VIEDSYGDGIYGLPWCQTSGSVLISTLGDSLTGISEANSDFGASTTLNFCVTGGGVNSLNEETFTVYPNPSHELIHWVSSSPVTSYSLSDIQGKRIIENHVVKTTQFNISLENLSIGMYFLDCIFENGRSGQIQVIKN
jgi:hypothetical protein